MRPLRALQLILGLSLFGTLFSGTLTYRELFGATAMSCPAPGAPGTVFGWPACVYGFFMYLIVAALAAAGLRGARREQSDVWRVSAGFKSRLPDDKQPVS